MTYMYADLVRKIVDKAPPLTVEQRAKLALLLRRSAVTSTGRAVADAV